MKRVVTAAAALILTLGLGVGVGYAAATQVRIKGQPFANARIVDGQVMVPAAEFAKALGATVTEQNGVLDVTPPQGAAAELTAEEIARIRAMSDQEFADYLEEHYGKAAGISFQVMSIGMQQEVVHSYMAQFDDFLKWAFADQSELATWLSTVSKVLRAKYPDGSFAFAVVVTDEFPSYESIPKPFRDSAKLVTGSSGLRWRITGVIASIYRVKGADGDLTNVIIDMKSGYGL